MPWKNGNPPLYTVWRSMLSRCYNSKAKQYKDYGGRGIRVCPQWLTNYRQFYSDMAPRPNGLTLDRKDNNGNYTPKNCKWSTRKEQQRNRRITRYVTIENKRHMVAELRDKCELKWETIIERAEAGLSLKDVLSKKRRYNLSGFALGAAKSVAVRLAYTHCKNGHEYTEENTATTQEGWRRCKTCLRNKIARRNKI